MFASDVYVDRQHQTHREPDIYNNDLWEIVNGIFVRTYEIYRTCAMAHFSNVRYRLLLLDLY